MYHMRFSEDLVIPKDSLDIIPQEGSLFQALVCMDTARNIAEDLISILIFFIKRN